MKRCGLKGVDDLGWGSSSGSFASLRMTTGTDKSGVFGWLTVLGGGDETMANTRADEAVSKDERGGPLRFRQGRGG